MKSLKEIIGAEPVYHEEDNSYTPSKASLLIMCPKKTNYDHTVYENAVKDGKWKILVPCVDNAYLVCQNGKRFRTGDHPVELFVVLKHLHEAGFLIEYATPNGGAIKYEDFAMPTEDETIMQFIESQKAQTEKPLVLSEVAKNLTDDSPYLAIYFAGGQGVLNDIPSSPATKKIIQWFLAKDKHIITICHGPSALLSLTIDEDPSKFPFSGYTMTAFPTIGDKLGTQAGYLPGEMPWYFCDKLKELGVDIDTVLPTGNTHVDRKLISGDSPLAANKLGKLASEILLESLQITNK